MREAMINVTRGAEVEAGRAEYADAIEPDDPNIAELVHRRALLRGRTPSTAELAGDDHGCADAHALVQVDDILIVHTDAAIRDEAADRVRPVGPVNGILTAAQGQGCGAHRIARRTARNDVGQPRVVALNFGR